MCGIASGAKDRRGCDNMWLFDETSTCLNLLSFFISYFCLFCLLNFKQEIVIFNNFIFNSELGLLLESLISTELSTHDQ
jgi:hypothetical protein